MEKTRILLRGFLCHGKSLLYSLLLCKRVFYDSTFLTMKFELCKQLFFLKRTIHCFEILHQPAPQHGFKVLICVQAFKLKSGDSSCLYSVLTFINMKISIFNQPQYFPIQRIFVHNRTLEILCFCDE